MNEYMNKDEAGQVTYVVKTKDGGFKFFPFQAELVHAFMDIQLEKSDKEEKIRCGAV